MHALPLKTLLLSIALCGCATPAPTAVTFTCDRGARISATFADSSATVTTPDGTFNLPQQVSGSGVIYSDGLRTFRGKGREMQWEFARRAPLMCVAL